MIRSMHIGDQRSYIRNINQEEIAKFGEISGDLNSAHFDEAYAKIAHNIPEVEPSK